MASKPYLYADYQNRRAASKERRWKQAADEGATRQRLSDLGYALFLAGLAAATFPDITKVR